LSAPDQAAVVPVGGIRIDAHHDDAVARVEPMNIDCGSEPFIAGKCRSSAGAGRGRPTFATGHRPSPAVTMTVTANGLAKTAAIPATMAGEFLPHEQAEGSHHD